MWTILTGIVIGIITWPVITATDNYIAARRKLRTEAELAAALDRYREFNSRLEMETINERNARIRQAEPD
jgi:hypothetical protein